MWLAATCLFLGALTDREKALSQFSIAPNWRSHIGTFCASSTHLPQREGGHKRGQCILFSVVFTPSPLQPPWQCLGPTCHLSTLSQHCIPESYDVRGFLGPNKEHGCGPLSIQSSLGGLFSSPKVITTCYRMAAFGGADSVMN